jgi:rhomboid protease GluP
MGFFKDEKKAYMNLCLIFLNVFYFLVVDLTGSSQNILHVLKFGGLTSFGVLTEHRYYLLLTSMFMHWGISHLINNMIVLFVLGDNLERALGRAKYLLLYLVSGIGANIITVFYYEATGQNVVSVGASGAIFGVIGGLLCIVIRCRGQLEDLRSWQLVMLIAFSLYHGFTSAGVNNVAHIGGMLIGILLGFVLYRKPKPAEDRW